MNNLTQRILTGSAYVAVMLFAVTQSLFIGSLLALVAVIGGFELKKIYAKQNIDFDVWPATILGLCAYATVLHPEVKALLFVGIFIYFISHPF